MNPMDTSPGEATIPAMESPKIPAWTDYPITQLGDEPNVKAPVRRCEVVDWNGDKYVWVIVEGLDEPVSIKRWYVYAREARSGEEPWLPDDVLERVRGKVSR